MAVTHGVLLLLTGDSHCAIEAGAAALALEDLFTQVVLELVFLTTTHSILVCSARRNLHLGHLFPTCLATEALFEVVLGSCKGALITLSANCFAPRGWTVTHQVGSFVALGTTVGIIQRVGILPLGTRTIPLLSVPKGRDQSSDP